MTRASQRKMPQADGPRSIPLGIFNRTGRWGEDRWLPALPAGEGAQTGRQGGAGPPCTPVGGGPNSDGTFFYKTAAKNLVT